MPPPTVIKTLMGTEYVKTCSTINCPDVYKRQVDTGVICLSEQQVDF